MQNILIVPAMLHGCRAKPLQTICELLSISISKQVFVQNHSYENKFDLHENKPEGETHFHMNGFVTQRQKWPITETKDTPHTNM